MNDPRIDSEKASTDVNEDTHDDIMYPSSVAFILVHLACFGAIWSGVTWQAIAISVILYWARMFAIGAGYHRYFSHRAYSTGRVFQFVLATTRASCTAIWGGSSRAGTMRPISSRLPTSPAIPS